MGMDRPWIGAGLRIARLGSDDLPALLLQRVALLRPGPLVDPDYVYWSYQARDFRELVEADLTGLSVPHLSGEQIESHVLALPDLGTQRDKARELDALDAHLSQVARENERSRGLLEERKRSLITAAVTGELDVSSASSRAADAVVGGR